MAIIFQSLQYDNLYTPFPVLISLDGVSYVTTTYGEVDSFGAFVGSPSDRIVDSTILSKLFIANQAIDFLPEGSRFKAKLGHANGNI